MDHRFVVFMLFINWETKVTNTTKPDLEIQCKSHHILFCSTLLSAFGNRQKKPHNFLSTRNNFTQKFLVCVHSWTCVKSLRFQRGPNLMTFKCFVALCASTLIHEMCVAFMCTINYWKKSHFCPNERNETKGRSVLRREIATHLTWKRGHECGVWLMWWTDCHSMSPSSDPWQRNRPCICLVAGRGGWNNLYRIKVSWTGSCLSQRVLFNHFSRFQLLWELIMWPATRSCGHICTAVWYVARFVNAHFPLLGIWGTLYLDKNNVRVWIFCWESTNYMYFCKNSAAPSGLNFDDTAKNVHLLRFWLRFGVK